MTKLTLVIQNDDGSSYESDLPLTLIAAPAPPPEPEPAPEPTPEPTPAPTSSIPLSFNDSRFASNVSSGAVVIASGATLLNKSIAVHAEPASVVMGNNTTMKDCAVGGLCREGVRIGGGTYLIDGCYLEATGTGNDHADTIQAYAGPSGGRLVLTIRNSLIRAHTTAATAGLFIADHCTGDITLENVAVYGGPYGVRIHPGLTGDNIIRFKDVFIVGPFTYDGLWVDARVMQSNGVLANRTTELLNDPANKRNIIALWDNVREATIDDNGQIVPGNLIPRPF